MFTEENDKLLFVVFYNLGQENIYSSLGSYQGVQCGVCTPKPVIRTNRKLPEHDMFN